MSSILLEWKEHKVQGFNGARSARADGAVC